MRLAKTVRGADNFELIVFPAAGRVVVKKHESGERLAGEVRIRRAIISADLIGQREAGGFQVALHAHLHPSRGGESRGVDDGVS